MKTPDKIRAVVSTADWDRFMRDAREQFNLLYEEGYDEGQNGSPLSEWKDGQIEDIALKILLALFPGGVEVAEAIGIASGEAEPYEGAYRDGNPISDSRIAKLREVTP